VGEGEGRMIRNSLRLGVVVVVCDLFSSNALFSVRVGLTKSDLGFPSLSTTLSRYLERQISNHIAKNF